MRSGIGHLYLCVKRVNIWRECVHSSALKDLLVNRVLQCCNSSKMESKAESCFLDLSSQSETEICSKDFLKKVKSEIVTSSSNCDMDSKTGIEDVVSNFCSQNQRELTSENPLMGCNIDNKDTELFQPKIEIKEEHDWVETTSAENLCIYDDIEDGIDKNSSSIKSSSVYKADVSSYTSGLFYKEDLESELNFKMGKGSPECESTRKCKSQENDVTDKASVEVCVSSETPDGGKIVSMASCFEENNINVQDITKENCKSVLSSGNRKAFTSDSYEKSFKNSSLLTNHRLVHKSTKAIKCDVCQKNYNHSSSLRRHKLIHEEKKSPKLIELYKCTICYKTFTRMSHLKTHGLIHEGIKPHKCDVCHKAFVQLQHLKRHKLIHDGIKPHVCNICDKTFTRLQHLKRHKLVHEDIKPHKCNICDKRFTHLQNLKMHTLIHDDIRPYKCNMCDKTFTRLQHLKRHKLIHKGIKPHKCNICNKSFTRLQCLKTHSLIHDGIRPNKCDICSKAFIRLSTLRRHKLIHEDKASVVKCEKLVSDTSDMSS